MYLGSIRRVWKGNTILGHPTLASVLSRYTPLITPMFIIASLGQEGGNVCWLYLGHCHGRLWPETQGDMPIGVHESSWQLCQTGDSMPFSCITAPCPLPVPRLGHADTKRVTRQVDTILPGTLLLTSLYGLVHILAHPCLSFLGGHYITLFRSCLNTQQPLLTEPFSATLYLVLPGCVSLAIRVLCVVC